MGKKSRQRNKTIYLGVEGYREQYFVKHIQTLFQAPELQDITKIEFDNIKGSTPVKMLIKLFKQANLRDLAFLIIDNDTRLNVQASAKDLNELKKMIRCCWQLDKSVDISDDITVKELANLNTKNRKPFIIATEPVNMDGFIIDLAGHSIPQLSQNGNSEEDKLKLKSKCNSIIGVKKNSDKKQQELETLEFYRKNFTKKYLQQFVENNICLKSIIKIFE